MLWVVSLILALVAVSIVTSRAVRDPTAILPGLAILGAVFLLFALARLETEVRDDAVYVHFHGIWPTRRIPLDDIVSYEAKRYTLWESGGWGVHLTMSGMAYNVSGNDGVIFKMKSGRTVLVGTQRPAEFAAGIAKALEAHQPPR